MYLVRTTEYSRLEDEESLNRNVSLVLFRSSLTLDNSTCCVSQIRFDGVLPFLEVDAKSFIDISPCIVGISDRDKSPIVSSGQVVMNEIYSNCPYIYSLVNSYYSESLSINSCLFRDTLITSRLSCLGDIYSCSVSGCSFINISCNERNRAYGQCLSSVMRDCMSSDEVMGIYGEILSGLIQDNNGISYSFVSSNNSFVACYRNRLHPYMEEKNTDYKDTQYTSKLSLSSSSSHTFSNCTFIDCTDSWYGGAIYFNSSNTTTYTLTITSCTFTNCSASFTGGAVCCVYVSSCVVSGCSFVKCKSTREYGGALYMSRISSCAGVKDSNISSCTAYCGGGVSISSINVTGTDCEGGVEYGIVSGCRFSNCNTTYSSGQSYLGGGLSLSGISVSTVRSCSFSSCYAYGYGGGLRWSSLSTEQLSLDKWIVDCVFELNSGYNGHDVYIDSSSSRSTSIFSYMCYTKTDQSDRVAWGTTNRDSWLPHFVIVYITAYLAGDDATCADSSNTACTTLSSAFTQAQTEGGKGILVYLPNGTLNLDSEGVSVSDEDTRIHGCSVSFSKIKTSSMNADTTLFTIDTGRLEMKDFSIILAVTLAEHLVSITSTGGVELNGMSISSNDGVTHSSSVLNVGNGSLSITSSVFCNTTLTSTPFISVTITRRLSSSFTFTKSTFSNITRSSGDGSVLEMTCESSGFSVSDITFDRCTSTEGSGGGMCVDVVEDYSFHLSSLNFTSCSCGSDGGGMYLHASEYVTLSTLSFTGCKAGGYGGGLYLENSTRSGIVFESLTFSSCLDKRTSSGGSGNGIVVKAYLMNYLSSYASWDDLLGSEYVAGTDVVYSGMDHNENIMSLVHYLFTPVQAGVNKIYVESTGENIAGCGWDDMPCLSISTAVMRSTMDVSVYVGRGVFDESVTSECGIRKVTIEPCEETDQYDSVTMNVGGSNDGFSVGSGVLIVRNMSIVITKVYGSGRVLICMSGSGNVVMEHLRISGTLSQTTTNTPLISLSSGTITTSDVIFTGIVRRSGDGSVFEIGAISKSLTFTDIQFVKCSCLSGSGGAFYSQISSRSSLTLSSLSFTECSASYSGGAIFLTTVLSSSSTHSSSSNAVTTLSQITFTSCSAGVSGGGVYIYLKTHIQFAFTELSFSENRAETGTSVYACTTVSGLFEEDKEVWDVFGGGSDESGEGPWPSDPESAICRKLQYAGESASESSGRFLGKN